MRIIPLQAIANQQLTVVLDDNQWTITLKETNGVICASLIRNGELIIENVRCVAGAQIIPSLYQEAGNFVFSTLDQQLPEYLLFGSSQFLLYYSAAELEVIREPLPLPISALDFDSLGALPLRFVPQGYVLA